MADPVLQPPSPSQLRDELQRAVVADLLGPAGGPEEELHENNVRDRYLVGLLAPRRQIVNAEEFDELAVADGDAAEEGPTEIGAPQAPTMFPSSFGMTFCVDGAVRELLITALGLLRQGGQRHAHHADRKPAEGLEAPADRGNAAGDHAVRGPPEPGTRHRLPGCDRAMAGAPA